MKAVLDASPIIAFCSEMRAPRILLLLRRLNYELLVPDAVFHKDIAKEPSRATLRDCVANGSIALLPPVDRNSLTAFIESHPSLGEGESEVILIVAELISGLQEAVCVIDEGRARLVAKRMGLPVTGTLGILRMLRTSGLINEREIARLKKRLKGSGFHADASLLS